MNVTRIHFLISVCLFVSGIGYASQGAWLSTLFMAQAKESASCSAPLSQVRSILARAIPSDEPALSYFASQADAREALKILSTYPGRSLSTSAIMEHIQTDTQVPLTQRVSAVLKLQHCNDVGYFKAFRHLIASVSHFPFSGEERQRVAKAVLDYVQDHLERPNSVIALAIRISLTQQLLDAHLVSLDEDHLQKFHAVQVESTAATHSLQEKAKQWPDALNSSNASQFPEATLRLVLDGVLFETKKVGVMQRELGIALEKVQIVKS